MANKLSMSPCSQTLHSIALGEHVLLSLNIVSVSEKAQFKYIYFSPGLASAHLLEETVPFTLNERKLKVWVVTY